MGTASQHRSRHVRDRYVATRHEPPDTNTARRACELSGRPRNARVLGAQATSYRSEDPRRTTPSKRAIALTPGSSGLPPINRHFTTRSPSRTSPLHVEEIDLPHQRRRQRASVRSAAADHAGSLACSAHTHALGPYGSDSLESARPAFAGPPPEIGGGCLPSRSLLSSNTSFPIR